MSGGVIRFGVFDLDTKLGELRHHGRATRLQDKPLQLLHLLLERPRELVSREEIRERVWGTSPYYDFDDSLNQAVSKLREALGDSASNPRFIETVPRRGYRFIAPVEGRPVATTRSGAAARPALAPDIKRITVGRAKELTRLRALFDEADAGRGHIACLTGEPGIGKTTLLEVFLSNLQSEGRAFRSLRGRCSERLAGEEAYLPLLEALETLLQSDADGELTRRVAPSWYAQVAPSSSVDSALATEVRGANQERLKRELVALVVALAEERPLLLFLDDLHWADISTVDALSYLGMRCGSLRLMIVVTYRPTDLSLADHPFHRVQLELEGRGLCQEIAIEFLAEQDIERYLQIEFPGNDFPQHLAEQIHRRTEGNPLFMADLLRDMRDRALIRKREEIWELDSAALQERIELPRSISAMIRRKVEKLPDEDRRLLVAAAVQGHEFDAIVVADVVCMSAEEVEQRLTSLDRVHDFVRLRGDHTFPDLTMTLRYGFVHALYQNALYDSLMPTQRASQSAAVARAMIARYGDRSREVAVDLAHLFEAAKDAAQAFTYFLFAARNAAQVAANREAVNLVRRATEQAERLHGDDRRKRLIEAMLFAGDVYEVSGRYEEQISAFRSAEALAAEIGDVGVQVKAACGQATGAFWQKRVPEMQEHSRRALDLARAANDQRATALVEVIVAREQLCLGDLSTANSSYERGIPILDEAGMSFQATSAATFRIMLHAQRLEFEAARRASERLLERAREAGVPSYAHDFQFAMALGNHGRLSQAMSLLREGIRLAELNNNRHFACRLYNTLGWLHSEIGDSETAVQWNTQGARISAELCNEEAEFNSLANLARELVDQGNAEDAWDRLRNAERALGQSVWFQWRFRIRLEVELAYHWIRRGDLARGSVHARQAIELAEPVKARKHIAWARKLLGDIAGMEDRPESAVREYEAALALLAHYPCPLIEWKILRSLAEVRKCLRLTAEADESLAQAREVVRSLAESITDGPLRRSFLDWKAVREL